MKRLAPTGPTELDPTMGFAPADPTGHAPTMAIAPTGFTGPDHLHAHFRRRDLSFEANFSEKNLD